MAAEKGQRVSILTHDRCYASWIRNGLGGARLTVDWCKCRDEIHPSTDLLVVDVLRMSIPELWNLQRDEVVPVVAVGALDDKSQHSWVVDQVQLRGDIAGVVGAIRVATDTWEASTNVLRRSSYYCIEDFDNGMPGCHLLDALLSKGLVTGTEGKRIRVAIQEALRNALEYGILGLESNLKSQLATVEEWMDAAKGARDCPGPHGTICLEMIYSGDKFLAVVRDTGSGFQPRASSRSIDELVGPKLGVGGRGLILMRHCMDEVQHFDEGRGVVMKKTLAKSQSDSFQLLV